MSKVVFSDQENVQDVVCHWLLPYLKQPSAVIQSTKKCIMGNMKPLEEVLDFERFLKFSHFLHP